MKSIKFKKILYIVVVNLLSLIFVASLTFGVLAVISTDIKDSLEIAFAKFFNKDEYSLLKSSIIWLLISSLLLIMIFNYKDFKRKYID